VPGAGNPQALNRYAMVFNNPLKYTDPSGHDPDNSSCSYDAWIGCGAEGTTLLGDPSLAQVYDLWATGLGGYGQPGETDIHEVLDIYLLPQLPQNPVTSLGPSQSVTFTCNKCAGEERLGPALFKVSAQVIIVR
jgi:hypothetical protein